MRLFLQTPYVLIRLRLIPCREQVSSDSQGQPPYHPKADLKAPSSILPLFLLSQTERKLLDQQISTKKAKLIDDI